MTEMIHADVPSYENKKKLEKAVMKASKQVKKEYIKHLVESFPKRIGLMRQNSGHYVH